MVRRICLTLFALCILASLTVQALASNTLDSLLDLAEQEPKTAGERLWEELQKEPEAFLTWLKEKDTRQRSMVFSAMEQTVPEGETVLSALYAVCPQLVDRTDVFRLILMLEKNVDISIIYEDHGILLEKALCADGAYADVCLRQLAKALQEDPEVFVSSMAERTEAEQMVLAVMVWEGLRFYAPDYDLESQLNSLEGSLTKPEQLACIEGLRGEKQIEQPVIPPQEETTVPLIPSAEETRPSGKKPAETAVLNPEKKDDGKSNGKTAGWWWLIPVGLVLSVAVIWYRKKKR